MTDAVMSPVNIDVYNGVLAVAVGIFLAVVLKRPANDPNTLAIQRVEQVFDLLAILASVLVATQALKALILFDADPVGAAFVGLLMIYMMGAVSLAFASFVLHATRLFVMADERRWTASPVAFLVTFGILGGLALWGMLFPTLLDAVGRV